jgi:hypothetical protein
MFTHYLFHGGTESECTALNFIQVSFQEALYCWVCQMLPKTSFQFINMYFIGGQNLASDLV